MPIFSDQSRGNRASVAPDDECEARKLNLEDTKIDRETMGRLAKVLAFIGKPDDPVVVALKQAAETGADRDIKQARALFLKLRPAERKAALASLDD
jgi:hypothetical protein